MKYSVRQLSSENLGFSTLLHLLHVCVRDAALTRHSAGHTIREY